MDAAQATFMGAKIAATAAALGSCFTILVTWLQNKSAEKRQERQFAAEREERKQAFVFEKIVGPLVEGKRQAFEELYGLVGRTQFRLPGRTELVPWELSAGEQQRVIQLLPQVEPEEEERIRQWGTASEWGKVHDEQTEILRSRILKDLRESLRFGGADRVLPDLLDEAFGYTGSSGSGVPRTEEQHRELWRDMLVVALAPTPFRHSTDAVERLMGNMMEKMTEYMRSRRRDGADAADGPDGEPNAIVATPTCESSDHDDDDRQDLPESRLQ